MADCVRCGAPLRAGARFCPRCGTSSDALRTAPPPAAEGGIGQTIAFFALWLASGVLARFLATGARALDVVLAIGLADFALTALWVAAFRRDVARLYQPGRARAPYAIAVAAAWPIAFAVYLLVTGIERATGAPESTISGEFLARGWGWPVIVAMTCLQPAVVEELAFRGVIQSTAGSHMRAWEAIVVAAVAFSIMHFSVVMFVPFTVLGLYLGWLRLWSGSLWPPMIAHFLHNLLVTANEIRPLFPL